MIREDFNFGIEARKFLESTTSITTEDFKSRFATVCKDNDFNNNEISYFGKCIASAFEYEVVKAAFSSSKFSNPNN